MDTLNVRGFHFNPLPPHGGRPFDSCRVYQVGMIFQSTPSAWRETSLRSMIIPSFQISIHSLRMEGDYKCAIIYTEVRDFNPLPPHGGRPDSCGGQVAIDNISIHSLRMEGDHYAGGTIWTILHFNPLPPHGGRLQKDVNNYVFRFISIHSLRMEGDPDCVNCQVLSVHFNPLPPHGGRP